VSDSNTYYLNTPKKVFSDRWSLTHSIVMLQSSNDLTRLPRDYYLRMPMLSHESSGDTQTKGSHLSFSPNLAQKVKRRSTFVSLETLMCGVVGRGAEVSHRNKIM